MTAACGLCENDLAEGYLCGGDALTLAKRLDRMPKLYAALGAFLAPGARRPELGRTRAVEAPLPVSEPVLDLRAAGGIVSLLESWRSFMQSDRAWGEPVIAGTVERRIVVAARALSINLDWMAASWPPVGDLAREIRDLERNVLSIVSPREPSLRLGECPALLASGSVCGAVLRVPAGTTEVRCRWCGTAYPPRTWLTLKSGNWTEPDTERTPS